MCIFCGGTCGGAGDALLPTLVASASLVVMRLRVLRSHSAGEDTEVTSAESTAESGPDEPTDAASTG